MLRNAFHYITLKGSIFLYFFGYAVDILFKGFEKKFTQQIIYIFKRYEVISNVIFLSLNAI